MDTTQETLKRLKIVLREDDIPFFTDEQLSFYLNENNDSFSDTAYQCLLIKAENTTMSIAGMTAADSSAYFRRLAARYRPHNTGILSGGY